MKVIYTLINPHTLDCYVWQTNSFSRRIYEHIANWLFKTMQLPTTTPIFVLLNTWKLIIDIFLTDDANKDERAVWKKMLWLWYNMKNKTFKP
jgi:hypothetical protein